VQQPTGESSPWNLSQEVTMRWFGRLGLAGLLLAAACSEPNDSAGPVLIQVEEAVHEEGSVVTASIKNLSSDHLQLSPCLFRLEQSGSDGSWRAAYEDSRPCPAELVILKGYATRPIQLGLPADLPTGVYRVRFPEIGRRGNGSEPFVVAMQVGGEFSVGQ
jgi:hypothetical protein